MRKPLIPDRRMAKVVGFGALVLAYVALYDAYQGRGNDAPWWIRWALPT